MNNTIEIRTILQVIQLTLERDSEIKKVKQSSNIKPIFSLSATLKSLHFILLNISRGKNFIFVG
jgi:hypothetical protein